MVRRFAVVSIVLALAACSAVTTGTSGGGSEDNADESGTADESEMESGEAVDEQNGDGDPGCVVGAEGCPCTLGGGCDPGLMCDLGICVPAAGDGDGDPTTTGDGDGDPTTTGDGDGDPTTTGDGDADPTTTGDGDGDPNFMCQLDDWCDEPDLDTCTCEGCQNDNFCSDNEDCICPDCLDVNACNGDNCVNTGNCFPYWESCNCPDCAGHPMCS
jgi:hypothetical protein